MVAEVSAQSATATRTLAVADAVEYQELIATKRDAAAVIVFIDGTELAIGERVCPVLTLRRQEFDARFPGVADRYELYPGRAATDRYHIFTYSEKPERYERFCRELRRRRTEDRNLEL